MSSSVFSVKHGNVFDNEHAVRAMGLLRNLPESRMPPVFSSLVPQRNKFVNWVEVDSLLDATSRETPIGSEFFNLFMKEVLPQYNDSKAKPYNPAVYNYIMYTIGPVQFFVASFFAPKKADVKVPAAIKEPIVDLLVEMNLAYQEEPQKVVDAVFAVFLAMIKFEIVDALHLFVKSLGFTSQMIWSGAAYGLVLALLQSDQKWRRKLYYQYTIRRLRCFDFETMDTRIHQIRKDPYYVLALLQQLPPSFPESKFQQEFVAAVYHDFATVPPDVGRQALVFACVPVKLIWIIMRWPMHRVVRERIVRLVRSEWRISIDEFENVIYRHDCFA